MRPTHPTGDLGYRNGDRVTAAGLRDMQAAGLMALARHFRMVHRACGVVSGLSVSLQAPKTPGSQWCVEVSAGMAFDHFERPLPLADTVQELSRPAGAGAAAPACGDNDFTHLVVLHGEPPSFDVCGRPVSAPPQTVKVQVIALCERQAWDVVLSGLRWEKDGPNLIGWPRMNAGRGFRQSFVASGVVSAGTTAQIGSGPGWAVWVDTGAAGFLPLRESPCDKTVTRPPIYIVVVGRQTVADGAADLARLVTAKTNLDGDPYGVIRQDAGQHRPSAIVSEVREDGFLLAVQYPGKTDGSPPAATPLDVFWMGVEQSLLPEENETADLNITGEEVAVSTSYPWPTFVEGDRLTAESLNAVQTTLRELQQLHNSTLHDWGVVQGCAVTILPSKRGVLVESGYALDAQGRELFLQQSQPLAIPTRVLGPGPATPQNFWVTARFNGKVESAPPAAPCRDQDVTLRQLSGAIVRWRDPLAPADERLVPGIDVILATVTVERGAVVTVTPAGRRPAVPSGRPHIAAGRARGDPALWKLWPDAVNPVGISRKIETSAGGFIATPYYLVQLEDGTLEKWSDQDALRIESVHVIEPAKESFKVVCLLQAYEKTVETEETWHLCWKDTKQTKTTERWGPKGMPPQDAITQWLTEVDLRVAWLGIEN